MFRAKFCLYSLTNYGTDRAMKAEFRTQYDSTLPEDIAFNKFTPSGNIEMLIDNPKVMEQLVIGKSYYLDFTPID